MTNIAGTALRCEFEGADARLPTQRAI